MKKVIIVVAVLLFAFAIAGAGAPPAKTTPSQAQIARGKYLVENVGMCGDCHSPRNEKGEFVKEKWLHGAPITFKATIPMPFAESAPAIAGLPGLDEDLAVAFMMGEKRDVLPMRPPMPEYRFTRADSVAVVKYLKSLKPPDLNQTAEAK